MEGKARLLAGANMLSAALMASAFSQEDGFGFPKPIKLGGHRPHREPGSDNNPAGTKLAKQVAKKAQRKSEIDKWLLMKNKKALAAKSQKQMQNQANGS